MPIKYYETIHESRNISTYETAFTGFFDNYTGMRDANTIGADKYFHCKANCSASQRGVSGQGTANA